MKNTGRIAVVLFLLFGGRAYSALEVKTELNRRVIETGESATLNITIPGSPSDIDPENIPAIKGLEIEYSGMSMNYSNINGNITRGVVLSFRITGNARGKYTLPPFILKSSQEVYRSKQVTLIVRKGIEKKQDSVHGFSAVLEISKKRVYLGEPLVLRYYLLAGGADQYRIEGIEKVPESKGCIIRELKESIDDDVVNRGGLEFYKTHVFSYIMVPVETGRKKAGGSSIIISYGNPYSIFSVVRKRRLIFKDLDLEVIPVPEKGRPGNYKGDIGSFTIDARYQDNKIEVFQEKSITLKISGTGNFLSLSKPEIEKKSDKFRMIMEEKDTTINVTGGMVEGEKTFRLTLIPHEPGDYSLGRIGFSFFDPEAGKFGTAKTNEINFTVTGEKGSGKSKDFERKEKGFSAGLIAGIISAVLMAFLLFFLYERRSVRKVESEIVKNGEETDEEESRGARENYQEIMKEAVFSNNPGAFLQAAENHIAAVLSGVENQGGERESELKRIKERIFSFRYGGGTIGMKEMRDLLRRMEKPGN